MNRATPAVFLLTLTLAGCGSQSLAEKIAPIAKDQHGAEQASCAKEGIAIFVGEREDVYGCLLEGVPPEHRPIEHIESASVRRCYIYTDGEAFDVTLKLQDLVAAQKASGVTVDEFPCLQ